MKKPMNILMICTDTLRADHLGAYGHPFIQTPHIDRFAARSVQFNNAFMESGPTIQMRRVWFTGKSLLPYPILLPPKGVYPALPGWRPLNEEDVTVSEMLSAAGYYTGFVTDVWHYFKPTMNLHRGFNEWYLEGGHETHSYRSGPVLTDYDTRQHLPGPMWTAHYDKRMKAYLMNTHSHEEEEYFCARTFRRCAQMALDYSRRDQPFFIWCDTFVPHEPWDGRKRYWWDRYRKSYNVTSSIKEPVFFYGADMFQCTKADSDLFHAVYAGMVTQLDFWFGYLVGMLEAAGLFENTVILFTSDHGTEFMEHGMFQKHPELLHREVTQLPLLVHHPEFRDAHVAVDGLVSALDFAPTILELAGVAPAQPLEGASFLPLATGAKKTIRDHIRCGYAHFGGIRTLEWNLIFPVCTPEDARALQAIKSMPDIAPDVIHAIDAPDPSRGVELYDTRADRGEQVNVARKHPDVVRELKAIARRTWPQAPKLQE